MKKLVSHKGFTLIELLVVIAIIAILSGTILVSLNSARSKAKDARIQAQMQQLKTQMELYYSSNSGTYGTAVSGTCGTAGSAFALTTNDGAGKIVTAITTDAGTGNHACWSTATDWAMSAKLSTGKFWCVDSTGASVEKTANIAATNCN